MCLFRSRGSSGIDFLAAVFVRGRNSTCNPFLDLDFQTCVDLSKKITLILSTSWTRSVVLIQPSPLQFVLQTKDTEHHKRYGNYQESMMMTMFILGGDFL